MTVADVIVVHFAFGSPFGVYQITRGVRSARSAVAVAAYFVLWPFFAAAFARDWLSRQKAEEKTSQEAQIAHIRDAIEVAAFSKASTAAVFEFRELFARYTGLTISLQYAARLGSCHELLAISGHKNIDLASACLARRNAKRLAFHQVHAKNEFTNFIELLAASHPNEERIRALALDLTCLLDTPTVALRSAKATVIQARASETLR